MPIFDCATCGEPVRADLFAADPVLCPRCEAEAETLTQDAADDARTTQEDK